MSPRPAIGSLAALKPIGHWHRVARWKRLERIGRGAVLAAGDTAQAERLLEETTTVLQDTGPWFLSPVRCFRAVLAVQRGDADGAIMLLHESLIQIRELQDKYAFVYALLPLAAAAILKGDDLWAVRILGARDAS
jgi:hypothetical protein